MLTAKQVAEILQASSSWVYAHMRELGGVRIGGLVRFDETKLKEAIANAVPDDKRKMAWKKDDLREGQDKSFQQEKRRPKVGITTDGGRVGGSRNTVVDKYNLLA